MAPRSWGAELLLRRIVEMRLLIEGFPGIISCKEIKKIFCRYGYVENAFEKEQAAKEPK